MLKAEKIKLTNTEKFSKEMLSLPIYHTLKNKEIMYVIKKINQFVKIKWKKYFLLDQEEL